MRPTISELRSWNIPAFQDAARVLDAAVADINGAIQANGSLVPQLSWEGTGRESAVLRSEEEIDSATEIRDALSEGSVELTNTYDSLYWAREFALRTVTEAEAEGLVVRDDGQVLPGTVTDPGLVAINAERICGALDAVDTADSTAQTQLKAVTDLANTISGAGGRPRIQLAGSGPALSPDEIIESWGGKTPEEISAEIAAMSPQDRALLINADPMAVGNTDGVPWDMRFDANEVNIFNSLVEERRKPNPDEGRIRTLEDMLAPWDDPTTNAVPMGLGNAPETPSNDYVHRNFLRFDPNAQGRAVEVVGTIDSTTQNIGVLIPGTGTTLNDLNGYRERVGLAMKNSPSTAAIVWQDADFPDSVPRDAPFSNYANTAAPDLVSFSQELQRQISHAAPEAKTTYVAHSYGGSILGTANALGGFYSDREVYAAPSGSGTGVDGPEDWHNLNPDAQRFTLTAPGDNIAVPQQAGETVIREFDFDHFVLSANPANFDGVTRLDTGYYSDGNLVAGTDAHSGIFEENSDSMANVIGVINGTEVTLYNPRDISFQLEGKDNPEFVLTPEKENTLGGPLQNLGRSLFQKEALQDPGNYHVTSEEDPKKVPVK